MVNKTGAYFHIHLLQTSKGAHPACVRSMCPLHMGTTYTHTDIYTYNYNMTSEQFTLLEALYKCLNIIQYNDL